MKGFAHNHVMKKNMLIKMLMSVKNVILLAQFAQDQIMTNAHNAMTDTFSRIPLALLDAKKDNIYPMVNVHLALIIALNVLIHQPAINAPNQLS